MLFVLHFPKSYPRIGIFTFVNACTQSCVFTEIKLIFITFLTNDVVGFLFIFRIFFVLQKTCLVKKKY